ncbi:MAG TPA: hypothetical protein GX699_11400 [Firmicutes bacterium]|nr:hypothetical protein [Bacillota bacterium]
MASRAYLLITVRDEFKAGNFPEAVTAVADLAEVDFADPVVGEADIVAMIAAEIPEKVADKVAALPCVENVRVLKIVSALERHRSLRQKLLQKLAQ